MTAVAEDLDLSWVTFAADDHGTPCIWLVTPPDARCGHEAVAIAVWDQPCACTPAEEPVCAAHRDEILAHDSEPGTCWSCGCCDAPVTLLRIEPIR